MAGARNSGDWPEAGVGWELGIINLKVHFFLWVREFFVLHRMVGRTWRGVLTPGYFEPCNFPSITNYYKYSGSKQRTLSYNSVSQKSNMALPGLKIKVLVCVC